jgi:hypothetical protein
VQCTIIYALPFASLHGFIHPPGSCVLCCCDFFSLSLSSLPFQMHEPVPALRSVLPSVGPPPACSITSNHRSIALGHSRRLAFGGIYYSLCSNLKDPDRQGQPKTPTVWTVVLEALARLQCCTASFIYRYTSILDVGKDFN